MARLARIVIPGVAHHVTQRGNRRQPVFFSIATAGSISISCARVAPVPGCAASPGA